MLRAFEYKAWTPPCTRPRVGRGYWNSLALCSVNPDFTNPIFLARLKFSSNAPLPQQHL
jgi:hypothetical protein